MYIKEFKKTTNRQGFTFQRGFKALVGDSGRILAATSGFAIQQGSGSIGDPDSYTVRYYLQDESGEWYPVNTTLSSVWECCGNYPDGRLLYKMLRQGAEEVALSL